MVVVGRLSLFGRGASRLHDSLEHLVGNVQASGKAQALKGEASA